MLNSHKYYGEWVAFIAADASVYFEPEIHTLPASNITYNSARVRGYAVSGTDDITEQGFEYWPETGGSSCVTSSGTLMQSTLTGLKPYTRYFYRSYVKTGNKTSYGEEMEFKTMADPTGVELPSVSVDGSAEVIGIYNINGQKLNSPEKGIMIIRYSDGTTRKVVIK